MKLLLFIPVLLFGCVVSPPPLIYSMFSFTITLFILLIWNITYIVIKKIDKKEYSLRNILKISLILMPFLSYIVSSFFHDNTEQCNEVLTISKLECTQMENLKTSLKLFKLDNGNYPSTKEGLGALIINPNPKKYPNYSSRSYLEILPLDHWKNPFRYNHYKIDGEEQFEIISFGVDARYGGEYEDIVYPDCSKKKVGFFEPFF